MTTPDTAKPSWWKRQNKIVKTIIIVFAVLFAIGIINGIATGGESDKTTAADTTTPAPTTEPTTEAPAPAPSEEVVAETTEQAPSIPEWQTTEDYNTWCSPDKARIDPELEAAANGLAIPEQGHIQALYLDRTDVIARVCAPIKGDDLARVAEDLAIGVKASSVGGQVQTMRVKALPDDTDPTARLADMDFQSHLHNGVGDEGAVLTAWKSVDER